MSIARRERDWLESVLDELTRAETEQDFLDNRHLASLPTLGEPGRQRGRLGHGLLVRRLSLGAEDDVGPMNPLGVEPVVRLERLPANGPQ